MALKGQMQKAQTLDSRIKNNFKKTGYEL